MLRSLFALMVPTFALAQGFSPEEAVKRMTLPDGFKVTCVAHEPMIRQPLSMSFDERGRLWVLQYIQYPIPAGLKAVKQDQYLRTVWDKVPEPPPHGAKGADKITILSDPDENGVYTKSKDFLTGLNLASGFCLGNGGVYVLQSPYLLFYPDKNGDDIPDGDPEVLLKGFGFDDTHSVANSLQWGPDGWLYGAAGSTSTSRIVAPLSLGKKAPLTPNPSPARGEGDKSKDPLTPNHSPARGEGDKSKDPLTPNPSPARGVGDKQVVEFQQGIWRYQPHTKRFELFSEGGGNTFGLDFDKHGQCIAGTNFGGVAMLHHMQGAYYVKGFSKHGPLHNPHAYGYFEHVPYKNFQGGHVTCGGILYEAEQFPEQYRGQYIAANLLSNQIHWHRMTPKGASFTAEHGGILLDAHDTWFRPVDCLLGPDGCVYVADWYDKRAAHLDPIDNWDKTNGRIYRIEYVGKTPGADATRLEKPVEPGRVSARSFDLRKKKPAELVELLKHPNMWWRKESRRMLGEEGSDKQTVETLKQWLKEEKGTLALEALWTMYASGRFDEALVKSLLAHPNEYVRAWAIRLYSDVIPEVPSEDWRSVFWKLSKLTETERSPIVFCQLAASAKRIPKQGDEGLYHALMSEDVLWPNDPAFPLMLWWAIEVNGDDAFYRWGNFSFYYCRRDEQNFVLERVARRMAATNSPRARQLIVSGDGETKEPVSKHDQAILRGIDLGLTSTPDKAFKEGLLETLRGLRKSSTPDPLLTRLLVRLGDTGEIEDVLGVAIDKTRVEKDRIEAVSLLASAKVEGLAVLLPLWVGTAKSDPFLTACIAALESLNDPKSSDVLLSKYPTASAAVKKRLLQALLSRPAWAMALFQAYEAGTFPKADLTPDHARTAAALNDPALTKLVEKHFGKVAPATPGEKLARINSLAAMLKREKPGDAAHGKAVFIKNCAACHQLHGEGAKVGPDLTTADRKNRGYMLAQIVDPSGYIRPEYLSFTINTQDGRTLQGMVGDQTPDSVTLATYLNGKVEKVALKKGDIETMVPSPVSMMPEKLLDGMGEKEIVDLFAFLASDPPSPPTPLPPGERGAKAAPLTPNPSPAEGEGSKPKAKYKVALISGSLEYKSDESLPILQKHLEDNYPVECVRMFRKTDDDIPGLEKLKECDLAIFFTRRLTIDGEQLKMVKDYCESGKPILGIRTASHGFQKWLEMDKEVFGGDYKNHYKAGPKCDVTINVKNEEHIILKKVGPYESTASLYRNANTNPDVTILMYGAIPDNKEPVTWTRERKVNDKTQRVFYTSLGHIDDFKEKSFMNLLTNATGWCLKDESITAK